MCFYSQASQKGVSETVSGLVFSFYALIMFVSSPLFGKIVSGAKSSLKLITDAFIVIFNYKCKFNFSVLF